MARSRFRAGLLVLGATTAMILAPQGARADEPAGAEVLFQEGRKLIDAGKYAEACPKFAASQKLSPAVGTLLNLADCYQQAGQTASAWARFVEAQTAAHRANRPDRERVARDRAAALEPKLTRMTITVADAGTAGLFVKRDGIVIDAAAFGSAVPVDPGKHVVEAEAEGRKKWSTTVETTGALTAVKVPELEELPREEPPPVAPPKIKESPGTGGGGGTQRVLGVIVLGVGLAGAAVGTIFALSARSKWGDAQADHCDGAVCDATGVALASDAQTAGTVSTIAFAAGGVAVVAGALIYLTAPSAKRAAFRLGPAMGPTTAGFSMTGSF